MILESIDDEVQRLADGRLESILAKLLADTSTPERCEQRIALISYVQTKLALHRLKKREYYYENLWSGIEGHTSDACTLQSTSSKVVEFTNRAEAQRRAYYESTCGCGSCRSRRESQRLKYAGA